MALKILQKSTAAPDTRTHELRTSNLELLYPKPHTVYEYEYANIYEYEYECTTYEYRSVNVELLLLYKVNTNIRVQQYLV